MNIWKNAVITDKGLALQSKLIQGTTLAITRAVVGAGTVTPGLLSKLTEVINPKQELTFGAASYPEEGKCAVPVRLRNDGLGMGYTATMLGVYAMDPDDGEILYLATQAESDSGTIVPSEAEMPGYSAEWTFYFQYGQADGVNVTVDPAGTITREQMESYVASVIQAGVGKSGENGAEIFNDYNSNIAEGSRSHAEGTHTKALGDYSHAEGMSTEASNEAAHAEGTDTKASGESSHAEGIKAEASGAASHAEGRGTKASGASSHAEGTLTEASSLCAHAEGYSTKASGSNSHAEGRETIAASDEQHVQGKYNVADTRREYAHIVGNGKSDTERSNAHTLDWDGNAWYAGAINVGDPATTRENLEAAPAYTYGTEDLTAGESPLKTGKLYFVYE